MASSQLAPQLGLQPQTIRDHAIQLEADIRALKAYRVNPLGKNRTPNWNMIEPLLESITGYLTKTQNLPTTSELAAAVHATSRAQIALSKDVTEIKNILTTPVRKSATPKYAQIVKDPYSLKPTAQTRPSIGHREILVKLNESDTDRPVHRATVDEIKQKVNNTLKNHPDPETRKTQIIAVKRHPSGDLTLFTTDKSITERLITHRKEWQKTLGDKAEVQGPIIRSEQIRWNNPSLENANILYSGWLKRNLGEKQASTMVVEFDREEDADHAIDNGIGLTAKLKKLADIVQEGTAPENAQRDRRNIPGIEDGECSCRRGPQTVKHILLSCPHFHEERMAWKKEGTRSSDVRQLLSEAKLAARAARFMLETKLLGQFGSITAAH
ncbi:hypothetical protein PISL3812_09887 [Talaromyces islandicus]|uniref:Uncharacterized protein n=1 Tax=Talaromyces islandicus TaxID=28573 RepID=A0A0U1MB32_TALIS|nr:hypothetical protein PISL3812_09887 [Talaromyces islandicus]